MVSCTLWLFMSDFSHLAFCWWDSFMFVACVGASFFFTTESYSIVWSYRYISIYMWHLFIHSLVDGYLRHFHICGMVCCELCFEQPWVTFCLSACSQLFWVCAQEWNGWIIVFRSLRSCHVVFHRGCTILHSHQQHKRGPVSPHPCQHLFVVLAMPFSRRALSSLTKDWTLTPYSGSL